MSPAITITKDDIIEEIKLSCKIPEIIEAITTRKLIAAAAAEAGIKVETEELQDAADKFRIVSQLGSAEETWAWLEKHGMTLDEFEAMVYNGAIYRKLANHLFADKVEAYFFENQLDYAGVVMYEVIIDDEDLAMELFYGIQEGEMSFYDVAHQYIQDIELRRSGGYQGVVTREQIKPEISAAVFAAKPPQVIKPIVTSQGVHLILVEEIIEAQLDDKLRSKILLNLFYEWTKQQVDQFEVTKNIDLGYQAA
ncbi:peptidylprolyl isomerase [Moorena producens JHB]|uniref:peptidylprolyl isomerase n=1 Tax=Moorena producens (strain JHB) TaxID=1454205 RepID=A0A1D9FU72_MOOP1|nr:peptidylprolyl isomerase [Moorena producens]AOY78901.1 peptidylprolyl isomerase [Moorena producens JHB]